MSLPSFSEACNYVEVVVFWKECVPGMLYERAFPEEVFFKALAHMKAHSRLRCFQKKMKVFAHMNTEFHHTFDEDNKHHVYSKNLISHRHWQPHTYIDEYKRDTLMVYKFEWTTALHDIYYVTKVVFKITNRCFLNFEARHPAKPGQKSTYHISFNYNHASHVEWETLQSQFHRVYKMLMQGLGLPSRESSGAANA